MSIETLQNYIDGQFVASSSSETIDLISPVDESVVGRSPVSNRADVDAAVSAAERAFQTWGRSTPGDRQAALLKLADAIEANADEIVEAQCRNTGQPKAIVFVIAMVAGMAIFEWLESRRSTKAGA